jgi:large subunit ribosomal protein L23
MPTLYNVIKRPLITEKGWASRKPKARWSSMWLPDATKTEVKQAVETLFKVKVRSVRTANFLGKERRRGKFSGFRPIGRRPTFVCSRARRCPTTSTRCKC